jgi:LytS/YehU family sensor histidine kinase
METWVIIVFVIFGLLLLTLLALVAYLSKQNERMIRRNAEISAKNTSLEMHKLKFALQPHTLNNILANVRAMSNQISRSMESLSDILKYIFYHGEDHMESIENEVKFIKNYVNLQSIFSREVDCIQLNLTHLDTNAPNYSKPLIPHLITAYLIENAFKHGDINHREFLQVTISSSDKNFSIVVKNKTKPNYEPQNKGIGIQNMTQRLKHLKEGKYTFETNKSDDEFTAALTIKL